MAALIEDLDRELSDDWLYSPDRFVAITLPDEAQQLLAVGASGPLLHRLNRLLLEAAYPALIALSFAIYRVGPGAFATLADASQVAAESTAVSVAPKRRQPVVVGQHKGRDAT